MRIRVQDAPFDPGFEVNAFTKNRNTSGAAVFFTGIVRDIAQAPIEKMEIEHYPAMTQKALLGMAQKAAKRWMLEDVLIIHRYGTLFPSELIMMVAVAAPHRQAAFDGCAFLMDYLKSRAPFWKKEVTKTGANWVESKVQDIQALQRWEEI